MRSVMSRLEPTLWVGLAFKAIAGLKKTFGLAYLLSGRLKHKRIKSRNN